MSIVSDALILMNDENLARVAKVAWITEAELSEANEMAALDVETSVTGADTRDRDRRSA